jgi:HEAT repeat protein
MLAGIASGGGQAFALELTGFVSDPRVRPALIVATRAAQPPELGNVAQALGIIGGPGAREALRDRMEDLLAPPETFAPADFCNWPAGCLQSIAEALLFLEADALDAARVMVRLCQHPCGLNRSGALRRSAEVLKRRVAREAMTILEEGLRPFLTTEDPEAFTSAAPALALFDPEKVRQRCIELLDNPAHEVRHSAARVLLDMGDDPLARAAVLRWLPGEPSIMATLGLAYQLGDAGQPILAEVVQRALDNDSPALRHHGISALNFLPRPDAIRLASRAMADEPDPALGRQLQQVIDRGPSDR